MRRWIAAALGLAVLAAEPAFACRFHSAAVLEDVRYADLVLVGRIRDYHIVRDEAFRERLLAVPDLPPDRRAFYEGPGHLLSDYARVEIEVEEVLFGEAPRRLTITWYSFVSGGRERFGAGEPRLVALRLPASPIPPLRGPSATIVANAEPDLYTILEAPCSNAFVFDTGSDEARAVRQLTEARSRGE